MHLKSCGGGVLDGYNVYPYARRASTAPSSEQLVWRVIGVFSSAKATFEDIVRKPSWLLPVLLTTILSVGVSVSINQRINWREFMSQQIEKSPRAAQLSAEQKQQQKVGCVSQKLHTTRISFS